MYNHGLAHLLAHVQDKRAGGGGSPTQQQHGRQLLRGAVVALNCSQVMIDRHLAVMDNDGRRRAFGGVKRLQALIVSAMNYKTILWMSRLENQDREAEQAAAMLSHVLGDIARHQQEHQRLLNMCPSAAA